MNNRRRFLQILAAAPFAPWKEILKEVTKPRIFYSIPPTAGRVDYLDLRKWGTVAYDGACIQPGQIVYTSHECFHLGQEVVLIKGDGKTLGTFTISYADSIGSTLLVAEPQPKITAKLLR